MAADLELAAGAKDDRLDTHKRGHLFHQGIEAFNSAQFFEAHEFWEELWLQTPLPDKTFLQGLIQIAAGFHHYTRMNRRGAQRLLEAGIAKLESFPAMHWGLDLASCRESARQWLTALASGDGPVVAPLPRIQRSGREGAHSHRK